MIEDDGETTSETGASTRATSVESETGTAHLSSSHPREQPKTHGCLNPHTATEPTTSFLDCPTTPSIVLPQDRGEQTAREGDYGAVATVKPSSLTAATPPSPELEGQRDLAQDEEEDWEIVKIVDKRWTRRGCEYMVRWKNTWMSDSELRNAARLVREFDAQVRGQRGGKRGRPARAGKNGRLVAVPKCS